MTKNDLLLQLKKQSSPHWLQILQYGVQLEAPVGKSVRHLLEQGLGFANDYVDGRIETVFVNGKPVDDIDAETVPDDATVALAAALPGAAGIAMRRNSPYKALRGGITASGNAQNTTAHVGEVTIKLFNALIAEQGMTILSRGAGTIGRIAGRLLKQGSEDVRFALNGKEIDSDDLAEWCEKNPETSLRLRVEILDEPS